ncbi:MAG: hypothetical protein L0191_09410, partial [Acidobacteria bacterium]|nr:hypothetical protein [Acidobacteriota bacterium]
MKQDKIAAVVRTVVLQVQEQAKRRKATRQSVMLASDQTEEGRISTGCLALDLIMGGGVYYGRPVEFYGAHATGKSLVLAQLAREVQRLGGVPVKADIEGARQMGYETEIGIDHMLMPVVRARVIEDVVRETIDVVTRLRDKLPKTPIYVALDSLAAATTRQRLAEGLEKHDLTKAKVIRAGIELLSGLLDLGLIAIAWANQQYDAIQTGFVPYGQQGQKRTSGGKAPGYWAHARVELTRLQPIKEGEPPKAKEPDRRIVVGEYIGAFAEKTRVTAPYGKCVMLHRFGKGLDRLHGLWDALVRTGRLTEGPEGWRLVAPNGEVVEFDQTDFEALVQE